MIQSYDHDFEKGINTRRRMAAVRMEQVAVAIASMPQPVSREQIFRKMGLAERAGFQLLRQLTMIPWCSVETVAPTSGHAVMYRVTVDEELKAICDAYRPSGTGESAAACLRRLERELKARRKEAHVQSRTSKWNPDNVNKMHLIDILNWIEGELQTFNLGSPTG
jgi:hypothetical protein